MQSPEKPKAWEKFSLKPTFSFSQYPVQGAGLEEGSLYPSGSAWLTAACTGASRSRRFDFSQPAHKSQTQTWIVRMQSGFHLEPAIDKWPRHNHWEGKPHSNPAANQWEPQAQFQKGFPWGQIFHLTKAALYFAVYDPVAALFSQQQKSHPSLEQCSWWLL